MPGTVQSFQPARSVSASSALNSHVKGGLLVLGLFFGICIVRAVSGSPLCKCALKLHPASRLCVMPIKCQGIPTLFAKASYLLFPLRILLTIGFICGSLSRLITQVSNRRWYSVAACGVNENAITMFLIVNN